MRCNKLDNIIKEGMLLKHISYDGQFYILKNANANDTDTDTDTYYFLSTRVKL